jgi:hypothetical protein
MLQDYFLETQYAYMGWSDVFLELVNTLREEFNAEIIHKKGGYLYIEKFDYNLPDCELVIYDEKNDILKAITWSESPTDLFKIFEKRSNKNDILLLTQQVHWLPPNYDFSVHKFTVKPTTFYTFTPKTNHNHFYNLRRFKDFNSLKDQLFWLSTTRREDPYKLYELGLCPAPLGLGNQLMSIENYLKQAIEYKVGLSISSNAELCYRDIEYMAIGLPMLRLEYFTPLDPPLIPDYHYISIPRGNFICNARQDRIGGDEYIEAYKKRFFEVKDDKEFLNFITKNAKEYYDAYCSPQNRIVHLVDRLELKNE